MTSKLCCVLNPRTICDECKEVWCHPCWITKNGHYYGAKEKYGILFRNCPVTKKRIMADGGNPLHLVIYKYG